ncbi:phage portal protein [Brevundimonas pondensis]|uniref:Phage portal protein n=1 Tax=Brevundimonas pondensis TaxID=2774189 RepID=A0ABX7SMU4_9CAUL|nr:phage portal protein [Brevundimonas pondensis]QTC88180.1 phage portal protein [Brevundimonas pondensis]
MSLLSRLFGGAAATAQSAVPVVQAQGGATAFHDLNDPRVIEYLRDGLTAGGMHVTVEQALRNTTVFRCVDLICSSVAMLPLNLHRETADGDFVKATEHPVQRLLRRKPNGWQTPFEFKGLMQYRALTHDKGAVALIVRTGSKPSALLPLNPDRVDVKIGDDFEVTYTYLRKSGGRVKLAPEDVFHLRGLTFDGINGISRVRRAAEAIGIALQAERATAALFKNGTFASGALKIPNELSPEAYERLKISWNERHQGAENAGSTPLLEGGAEYQAFAQTAREAQTIESRRFQVEEILRTFGVPRPLAMLDDTGWGTGIEQLSIGFVRFGLNPWFTAWQEAIGRSLLTDAEADHDAKFNPAALLNGTMKDQYDAFAKASGAGGHKPWMTPNEIRKLLNMPAHPDGNRLEAASGKAAPISEDTEADAAATKALAKRKPVETDND